MNELQERVNRFIDELGVSVTNFAKNLNISLSTFYKWQSGERKISSNLEKRISDYLEKYGF